MFNLSKLSGLAIALVLFPFFFLKAQPHVITNVSPATADIGQTLGVTITGNDINWSLCCGSACSVANKLLLSKSGTPSITSNSYSQNSVDHSYGSFTIPNDASYLGLWNISAYNSNSWCLYSLTTKTNAFNITMQPNQNAGYLQGRIIQDNDKNCADNTGDGPLSNRLFVINPGNIVVSTDTNGYFGLWLPLNNYTLTVPNAFAYSGSCPATLSASLMVPFDTVNILAAMQPDSIQELAVSFSTNAARPGFNFHHNINYQNLGGITVNASLKVAIDTALLSPSSVPPWTSFANDTAYYNLPNLIAGTGGNIILSATIPVFPNVSFGQKLRTWAQIEPWIDDSISTNNAFRDSIEITGAYDPNDKRVLPAGYGTVGGISTSDSLLTYRIRFQNTGNDTAFNVVVRDTMDPNLDLSTLTMLGASHPYQFSIDSGKVAWTFSNILLPDSFVNEPLSHGWIMYSVEQNPGLPHGTVINNGASIYFDFNPPIHTNVTQTTICLPFTPGIVVPHKICPGDSLLLSTSFAGKNFLWSTGDSVSSTYVYAPGTYQLFMEDNIGCPSNTATATVQLATPVTAGYTYSGNQVIYSFTDQSSASTSWSWDFGDGNTSTAQNPTHTYAGQGTYTVCQIAQNVCYADTTCQVVSFSCPPPSSGFGYTTSPLTLNCSDQATGGITSWQWDFGDGSFSSSQNPTHVYSSSGTYNVCQMVNNGCGWDTTCISIYICNQPSAKFLATPVNYTTSFTDQTYAGAPTNWSWNFGDGNTSNQQNPVHTYAGNGTYTVCLTSSNSCGSSFSCQNVLINCTTPTAGFSAMTVSLTGTFSDLSSGTATSWLWDYGDGNNATIQNPTHTYATAGIYSVCQVVSNSCGQDTSCQQVQVNCGTLVSSFNYSLNATSATFSDQSTGSPTSWSWNFGDGNTSNLQNPTHNYSTSGNYNVCLISSGNCGADTVCQTVVIACGGQNSAFTFSTTNYTVGFTDQSTGTTTSWSWDFGDGSSSTQQNPSHSYGANGTYTVCLATSGNCGTDTVCNQVVVNCQRPVTSFTQFSTNLNASFSDQSSGNPGTWSWDFGDGNTSTQQNPAHTYSGSGTYSVCLIAGNSCGADTSCQNVTIVCPTPGASYSSSSNGFTATFSNSSTNATSWSWDFGDGNTSTQQNPAHTYSGSGTYSVCFIAGIAGADTSCQNVTIVCPTPGASYSSSSNGFTATFSNSSTNATSWSWDFGDGNTSTQQNPSHTYTASGTYNVCLTATSVCGTNTSCQNITIVCPTPGVSFGHNSNGLTVTFINSSSAATSYFWDFGDGANSSQMNPVHTYSNQGTYTVCLTASSICGSVSSCQSVIVNCPPPQTAFTSSNALLTVTFTDQTSSATAWSWDFGDGNISTQQNPVHTYSGSGTFQVCLTATSSCGNTTQCQMVSVTCPQPTSSWSYNQNGYTVTFTDQSTGATSWSWNFGDGTVVTTQSPVHTFAASGTYFVCLTSSNGCASSANCQSIVVSCPIPTAAFNYSVSGTTVTFLNQSTGNPAPTGWSWDFGDGNTSAQQNPVHGFATNGTYNVCLTITSQCGAHTSCQDLIYVSVPEPDNDGITVYPNPTRNRVFVELEQPSSQAINIILHDLLGKELVVDRIPAGQTKIQLDLSQVAQGSYMLAIRRKSGTLFRKVVVR